MKKTISYRSEETLDIAKHVMYSVKVLAIGLFIPFSFVFGISYQRQANEPVKTINVSKASPVAVENNTIKTASFLPDKNS